MTRDKRQLCVDGVQLIRGNDECRRLRKPALIWFLVRHTVRLFPSAMSLEVVWEPNWDGGTQKGSNIFI